MDTGSLLLGLALLGLVALLVAQPLFETHGPRPHVINDTERLVLEREQLLAALRDLDFDQATGKLTDDDYTPQRAALVTQSALVLKQLDALQAARPQPVVEPEPRVSLPLEDFIEAQVAARRRASAALAETTACAHCGANAQASDRFCPQCGTTLTLACSACGQIVRPTDRFCPHCGVKQVELQPAR